MSDKHERRRPPRQFWSERERPHIYLDLARGTGSLRVAAVFHNGRPGLDVRLIVPSPDGSAGLPTRKGIRLRPDELVVFQRALTAAIEDAREYGLLPASDADTDTGAQ